MLRAISRAKATSRYAATLFASTCRQKYAVLLADENAPDGIGKSANERFDSSPSSL